MVRRVLEGPVLCLALAGCATTYGEWKLGRVGGYKQERLARDRWAVTGISTSQAGPSFGYDMALFRGAVLVKAAGFGAMQIVNFPIEDRGVYGVTTNQVAKLTVVGTNDPRSDLPCEAKSFFQTNCRTLNVDEAIAYFGPRLGRSADVAAREVATARANPLAIARR